MKKLQPEKGHIQLPAATSCWSNTDGGHPGFCGSRRTFPDPASEFCWRCDVTATPNIFVFNQKSALTDKQRGPPHASARGSLIQSFVMNTGLFLVSCLQLVAPIGTQNLELGFWSRRILLLKFHPFCSKRLSGNRWRTGPEFLQQQEHLQM